MDLLSLIFMFILNIAASYFILANIMLVDKINNDLLKFYHALLMASVMMIIELLFMLGDKHKKNTVIIGIVSMIILSVILVVLIRNQVFIDDKQFLKGMDSHHQAAILMAEKIEKKAKDERVKNLAQNIITTQSQEIKEMREWLKSM